MMSRRSPRFNRGRVAASGLLGGSLSDPATIFGSALQANWIAHADNVTLSTLNVTGWADSQNSYDLAQLTAGNEPQWDATGWNGASPLVVTDRGAGASTRKWMHRDGDALADLLDGDDTAYGAIVIGQAVSVANGDVYVCWGRSSADTDCLLLGCEFDAAADVGMFKRDSTTNASGLTSTALGTSRHVIGYRGDSLNDIYVDDTLALSGFSSAAVGALAITNFTIGALRRLSVSNGSAFGFKQILILNRKFTDAEFDSVQAWAAAEYGGL